MVSNVKNMDVTKSLAVPGLAYQRPGQDFYTMSSRGGEG